MLAISTDFIVTLSHWAKELNATYPLVSDHGRTVSEKYGVLNKLGLANRTTFVVDLEGKIQHIEEGKEAVDPLGAANACSRIRKK